MQSLAGPTDSLNEWQILLKGQEISLNKRANMTVGPGFYNQAPSLVSSSVAAENNICLRLDVYGKK